MTSPNPWYQGWCPSPNIYSIYSMGLFLYHDVICIYIYLHMILIQSYHNSLIIALFPYNKQIRLFKRLLWPKIYQSSMMKTDVWNGGNLRTCYGTLLAEVSWLVSGIQICGWFHVMSNFLFVKYKLIWRIIWGIAIGWDDLLYGNGQKSIYPVEQKINSILRFHIRVCHHKESNGPVFRVGSWLKAKESIFPKNIIQKRMWKLKVFGFSSLMCFFVFLCCFVCFVFRNFQTFTFTIDGQIWLLWPVDLANSVSFTKLSLSQTGAGFDCRESLLGRINASDLFVQQKAGAIEPFANYVWFVASSNPKWFVSQASKSKLSLLIFADVLDMRFNQFINSFLWIFQLLSIPNPKQPPGMYKTNQSWDKLPTSTGAGSIHSSQIS